MRNRFKKAFTGLLLLVGLAALTTHAIDIRYSWTASTDPTVVGYRVQYRSSPAGYYTLLTNTTATSLVRSNVDWGYHGFTVKAVDCYGNESNQSAEVVTNLVRVLPSPPIGGKIDVFPGTNATLVPFP